MTSNDSPKRGWSAPKQCAACVAAVSTFAIAAVVFVHTQSPVSWEQASFSQTPYVSPSPFERAVAAHAAESSPVATGELDSPETR